MITAKIKNNLKFPKIVMQDDLEHIAKAIIIPDLITHIRMGASITGTMLPYNEPETIKRKGSSKQLIETGTLLSSFYYKLLGKDKVLITVDDIRKDIGGYLQNGIMTKRGLKQYIFFGISKVAETSAIKYMKRRITEILKVNKK